jgi:hypothetical protein
MMIRTTLTDDQIAQMKAAIDCIRQARDLLTDLAGPCYYANGEIRTPLREKFMMKANALNPMMWDLMDSYEGIMNYKKHINKQ